MPTASVVWAIYVTILNEQLQTIASFTPGFQLQPGGSRSITDTALTWTAPKTDARFIQLNAQPNSAGAVVASIFGEIPTFVGTCANGVDEPYVPPPLPTPPPIPPQPGPGTACDLDDICARVDALQRALTLLALNVNLIVRRVGPNAPLERISISPVSGDGSMALALGTRQVMIGLTALGPSVDLATYGVPNEVGRAGNVRFGNDFGWGARQRIDSQFHMFPAPPDATMVSWSLSSGTSGQLQQLGQPL